METSAVEIPDQHRHNNYHRSGKRYQSYLERTKKVLQELAVWFFVLVVMLLILYVWASSGSPDTLQESSMSNQTGNGGETMPFSVHNGALVSVACSTETGTISFSFFRSLTSASE